MKQKNLFVAIAACLILLVAFPAYAEEVVDDVYENAVNEVETVENTTTEQPEQHIFDLADLLTDEEELKLETIFDGISSGNSIAISVVTSLNTGSKDIQTFADDFFDENGLGFGDGDDGVMLLLSMAERDWYVITAGEGILAMSDVSIDIAMENVLVYLGNGDYYDAFECFAWNCDTQITAYFTQPKESDQDDFDDPIYYDGGYPTEYEYYFEKSDGMGIWGIVAIAAAVSLIAALVTTGAMKRQLISVRPQYGAESYVRHGSFTVSESRDIYLYTNVIRTPIPKDDDHHGSGYHHGSGNSGGGVHISSGGVSHGGHGGKF